MISITIKLITTSRIKTFLTSQTHEAVLFFETKEKKKKTKPPPTKFWGIGNRPTHKNLLPQLVASHILTDQYRPILYDQDKHWGVGEIFFHSLGVVKPSFISKFFRLENPNDQIRIAGGELARQHLKNLKRKPKTVLLIDMSAWKEVLDNLSKLMGVEGTAKVPSWESAVAAFTEGMYLGVYQYEKYKKTFPQKTDLFTTVFLFKDEDEKKIKKSGILNRAKILAEGVNRTRHLVNAPPNDLHSDAFVMEARKLVSSLVSIKGVKATCRIFNKQELKRMKMNSLLAVNAGSRHEAKLAVLDNHYFSKKGKTILLVGKGVLFDSGGLSLKPSSAMSGMKMDMAGGAAVFSAFEVLVRFKTQARIIAIIPLTDNMTGENAMQVGDVLTTRSGKTVEVLNTDAEGRLILCDALSYGIETYRPDYILDLATLTGACLVALGTYYAGLFTSADDLAEKLLQSSANSNEPIWRLPLDDLYLKELQSDIADLKNIGSSYGGAITAAKFLEQFIPEKYRSSWAHLDIAPVMEYSQTKGYQIKGGSGFGVRLIVDFVERLAEPK